MVSKNLAGAWKEYVTKDGLTLDDVQKEIYDSRKISTRQEFRISRYVINNRFSILVKPSAPRTEILGWDESRKALRVAVAAPPDKDKANIELCKFLSKGTGKKVRLVKGRTSREKVVEILG